MSKPPPRNEWQPPQAERIATGIVDCPPTAVAGNPLFPLQQPLPYWPLLPAQVPFLSSGMSLLQQCHPMTQVPPAPVPFSLNNRNDAAVYGHGRNGSRNGNDLDTTTIDNMNENNDNVDVGTSEDTTPATHGSCNIPPDEDTNTLYVGQVFANEKAFNTAVEKYCNDRNYDTRSSTSKNKNQSTTYFRTICVRGGVFKSQSKGGEDGRTRISQKVGCQFKITGRSVSSADIRNSNDSVKIITLDLEHTNTCKGADELVRATTKQLRGRKYSNTQLAHLKKECMSGRYNTTNVKDWLTDQGHTEVTLKEATNLRYRLMKSMKIQGFVEDPSYQELGKMTDYLINYDLKQEVTAGGQKSVDNLVCVHKGLSSQIPGYDYRMTTDSENRFSGTAWQTGRMRRRLRDSGMIIFLDDSRSGINTAGFCFWNVVVIDHNGKVQTVMGAMTMSPTNEAVYWVLSSMVQMTPEAADTVQCLMSDLGKKTFLCAVTFQCNCTPNSHSFHFLLSGVGVEPVTRALPNIVFCGACTWHIMVIDFPKNVGHITDYESCKDFVYSKLVRNTVDKLEWENYLLDACQQWPATASYLQELAKTKERWAAPWRYEHFTAGYESSSPVEGSFSAFQRYIGDQPTSFVGVVQSHVRKDREKLQEERVFTNRDNIARTDPRTVSQRTDAENECAMLFSSKTTEFFEKTNRNSQNYESKAVSISPTQLEQGATEVHEVSRRAAADVNNPPRPRVVMKINGVFRCSCKKDINWGRPCDHIQCVLGGAFSEQHFCNQWRKRDSVVEDPAVGGGPDLHIQHSTNIATVTANGNNLNHMLSGDSSSSFDGNIGTLDNESFSDGVGRVGDGVGVFVTEYAPSANTSTSTGTLHSNKRRKTKLDHTKKYNLLLEEGKQIASIVSSENEDNFYKTIGLLKWLRSNIQNKTAYEVKVACADYLKIDLSSSSTSTDDAMSGDVGVTNKVLAPVLKRPAGSMSTKRRKNCVEVSVVKRGVTCKFCVLIGHTIKNCPHAAAIGRRITKATWMAVMGTVSLVDGKNMPSELDIVVPSDALGLQIVSCVCHGLRSEASDHTKRIYCCKVVLRGMKFKECRDLWFKREVIDNWAHQGASASHYVFIKG